MQRHCVKAGYIYKKVKTMPESVFKFIKKGKRKKVLPKTEPVTSKRSNPETPFSVKTLICKSIFM